MKYLLCATVALSVIGGAVAAQAQEANWTGGYIGAQAGWGSHDGNSGESTRFDTNLDGQFNDTVRTSAGANAFSPGFCGGSSVVPINGSCSEDDSGFEFGLRAGYDWNFGNFVLGVVGEASRTNLEDSVTSFSTTPAFYTMTRDLEYLVALRARGGFAFGGNLLYATGGVAQGQIDHKFFTNNAVNSFTQSSDDRATGYQVGGGFERMLTKDVTMGIEYIYTNLEDDSHKVRAQGPAPAANPFILVNGAGTDFRRSEEDFKIHSVKVTAAYRF